MRNFILIVLNFLLIAALTACNDSGSTSFKIGVVDLNKIMRDCEMGKAGLKLIEAQQVKLQSELDELQTKLEKNPTDENALQQLQRVYATSQQQMQAEAENIVTQIFDVIQKVMGEYRHKNGYDLLLRQEAVDSFAPALDVTNAVLNEVNKAKVEFKSLVSPVSDTSPAQSDNTQMNKPASDDAKGQNEGNTPSPSNN